MHVVGISGINSVKSNQNFGEFVTIGRGAEVVGNNLSRCFPDYAKAFRALLTDHASVPQRVIFDGTTVSVGDSFRRSTDSPLPVIVQALNLARSGVKSN